MESFHRCGPVLAAGVAVVVLLSAVARAEESTADEGISFQQQILPLLRSRCQGCHQGARAGGGVNLTTEAGMLAAGESGLAPIKPGDPAASELIAQVTPDESGEALMPKQGKPLSAEEIDLLTRWIAGGAKIDSISDRPHFDQEHPPTYAAPPTISALDASPDGKLLAVSGTNETLLLDAAAAARGQRVIVHRLIGLSERIEALRFSPDGGWLAVAGGLPGELGELQVWNVADGKLIVSQPVGSDTLQTVAWSPDGKTVACGGPDSNLYVLDAESGEQLMEQGAHSDWLLDAVFSVDGKLLASGSRDETLKLVETETGRFVDNITSVSPNVIGGQVFALARHPQRNMVAVGGSEGVPRTYMMERVVERKIGDDSNLVRAYPAMPGRVFAVAFSPDGTRLAAASSDGVHGHVQVFAVPEAFLPPDDVKLIQGKEVTNRSAEEKARLEEYNHQGAVRLAYASTPMPPVYALAFLPDGETLASAGADGKLRFHDATHGTLKMEMEPCPAPEGEGAPAEAAKSVVSVEREATTPSDGKTDVGPKKEVEFLTDVMPVVGKLGCNSGTCHGARAGQNGFLLSLRGYDPESDHRALTDDLAGRRINRAKPEASLMLLKPLGAVPHGGGAVLETGTRRYDILRQWIEQGANFNADAPRVVGIQLEPQNPIAQLPGEQVAMRVTAKYSDGSSRDVTEDAFVDSGDTECATADAAGRLTAVRRGEAPVLARFEGAYAATTLTVMGDRTGFEWTQAPVYNRIDELVDAKLQRMKIAPSGLAGDEQFLRRVHLDLTGLPPTAEQVREFMADARDSRTKRAEKIDALIGNDDFVEHWTNRWADLLMVNSKFLGSEGATAYRGWIRQAVAQNKPYDQFVRELFTSTGSNREHPGGSYFKVLRTPDMLAETTSQVFLGVRFNCNKCHDHPFERWTQNDYYHWAAFFADVKLEKDPESGDRTVGGSAVDAAQPLFEMVTDGTGGEMIHLRTGKPAPPQFPFAAGDAGEAPTVLRQRAAEWLTSPNNRYFASSFVNRVWAQLTGVGIIEPIDDIRAGNPPTNPELLEWLTHEFVASGFDVRGLIRTICQSRTYQLSSETNRWNEDDRRNYSHALPRRLPAESLYDAVHRVVGSASRLPGMAPGTRAAALPDSMIEVESGLLSKLGRPARESGCECERSSDLQLGPVMALVNGPTFAEAIDDPDSELAKLEAATPDDRALVQEVFLRVLGRKPTAAELDAGAAALAAPVDDSAAVETAYEARRASVMPGFDAWRENSEPVDWTPLKVVATSSSMGSRLKVQDDDSVRASGKRGKGTYQVKLAAPTGIQRVYGVRLEAMADERLPQKGPGRARNGNFVLSEIRVFVAKGGDGAVGESSGDSSFTPAQGRKLKLRTADADANQPGYHIMGAIDGDPGSGWAVGGAIGSTRTAVFSLSRPVKLKPGEQLVVELEQNYDDTHLLGRFRLSATDAGPPLVRPAVSDEIRQLLAAEFDSLSEADRERMREYFLAMDREYAELKRAKQMLANPRLAAVQDLAWALINSPAFLFNH